MRDFQIGVRVTTRSNTSANFDFQLSCVPRVLTPPSVVDQMKRAFGNDTGVECDNRKQISLALNSRSRTKYHT